MHEAQPSKPDHAFESFMSNLKRDAEMSTAESVEGRLDRLLYEVEEDLKSGFISQEEVTAALAKLDAVREAARAPTTIKQANTLRQDILERYPLPPTH